MKRAEKNKQMKRRIMDSALKEFSNRGYGASSVNTISSAQGVSKGIIYHYFNTKDDLFLACVDECFRLLMRYLKNQMQKNKNETDISLESYFSARMAFFAEHPVYQRIFCEATMMPPAHLEKAIKERKKEFDELNILILKELLESLPLREQITKTDVIETFREFQDFINAKYRIADLSATEFKIHEQQCRRALNILLYGVVKRKK
ncbi:MAG: TetR/AcrR family transcriptional regulator [Christensenellales bacterium]|jgi:AcrR family transcriptional regulator